MKLLLLGKSGMLGSCFLKYLSGNADFEMYAFGHEDLDISNSDELQALFEKISPDFVLNCAAYTAVDDCESERELAFRVNATAAGEIAEACKAANATLVHFSTDYVFSGDAKDGYDENALPSPINVYGESKLEGEKLVQKNLNEHYIVRTSWLFGENGRNFVETMIRLGREKDEIEVVGDQFGAPTYTKDLCEAVTNFFLAPYVRDLPKRHERFMNEENNGSEQKLPFGIYHITNSGKTSWYDFAVQIFAATGMEVKVKEITSDDLPRPAKRPRCSVLINTKLAKPLRSWKEALVAYLNLRF